MKNYKAHSFANYPRKFRGCKVSPTKICMQFEDVQIKLRVNANDKSIDKLPKNINCSPYIAVIPEGTEIGCSAIGCQMPELEACQLELLKSYKYYWDNYKDTYKQVYDGDFIDFIKILKSQVDHLVTYMERKSSGT